MVRGVVLLLGLAILLICPPRTTHAQPEIYGRWSQVKAWTGSFTGTGTGTGQIGDDGKTRVTVRQSVNGAVTLHQIQPGACAWVGP